MTDCLQRLLDQRDIENLIVDYTHRLDFGSVDTIWELFAGDGLWEMPLEDLRYTGHDELRIELPLRLSDNRRTTRHVCTNTRIEFLDDDHATASTYMVNFRHDFDDVVTTDAQGVRPLAPTGSPRYVGEYVDTFVRLPEGWRFASRRAQLGFSHRA
ncbi:nuclear transport factor 2 family protein [Nocardioides terrisoli]|uniref:nuclear transport factor 2 family protein n=1 Tax=Nocardioides terrisoli TaxID=3388267 RepID=UPI00287BA55A|nr:nuclear transport factor 2 family protein [Nocardioides marmorisolisilvae]